MESAVRTQAHPRGEGGGGAGADGRTGWEAKLGCWRSSLSPSAQPLQNPSLSAVAHTAVPALYIGTKLISKKQKRGPREQCPRLRRQST